MPGLAKRRAMLAGQLAAANAEAARLHADLAAVDAVIRQLDPAYPVDAIQTKCPRSPAADAFADMGRTVLDVLRRAGAPLALPEVAQWVSAPVGPPHHPPVKRVPPALAWRDGAGAVH